MTKVRAIVVDDSPFARAVIRDLLERDGDIEVVAEAEDGVEAMARVRDEKPDVVTMDISMPRADGLQTLSWLMASTPVPVVMVTSEPLGDDDELGFEAMKRGAIDLVPKSALGASADGGARFRAQIRTAAETPVFVHAQETDEPEPSIPDPGDRPTPTEIPGESRPPVAIAAIVAGKGGAFAVTDLLGRLPPDLACPIVLALPLPLGYEAAYARFLGTRIALPVVVVPREGAELTPGTVYVGGENAHVVVERGSRVTLRFGPPERFVPSADELFSSLAAIYGPNAVGVVLSGRGDDGAAGLLALREAGSATMTEQPTPTSPADMPKAARPHADRVAPIPLLSGAIVALANPSTFRTTRRPPSPLSEGPGKRRVYLLDDSPLVLDATCEALRREGYDVSPAATIEAFEALLERRAPDLVIVDVDMPEIYGHDVASILRHVRRLRAPIFLFSTFDKAELAAAVREAPVDGYFAKSDGLDALLQGVRAIFHPR